MNNKRVHKNIVQSGYFKAEDAYLVWFPREYRLGWDIFYIGEMIPQSRRSHYGYLVTDLWSFTEEVFFKTRKDIVSRHKSFELKVGFYAEIETHKEV
jgi:hypothetical protein